MARKFTEDETRNLHDNRQAIIARLEQTKALANSLLNPGMGYDLVRAVGEISANMEAQCILAFVSMLGKLQARCVTAAEYLDYLIDITSAISVNDKLFIANARNIAQEWIDGLKKNPGEFFDLFQRVYHGDFSKDGED